MSVIKSWDWSRIIRLLIGIAFLGEAIYGRSVFSGAIGVFFLYQAAFKVGCAPNRCGVDDFETEVKREN